MGAAGVGVIGKGMNGVGVAVALGSGVMINWAITFEGADGWLVRAGKLHASVISSKRIMKKNNFRIVKVWSRFPWVSAHQLESK